MEMSSIPVFRENARDDLHCFEACVAMVLETLRPGQAYSLEDLAVIGGKRPKGWTWPMRLATWLVHEGFEVVMEDAFDYPAFAREGQAYLERTFGKSVADIQGAHANIPEEQAATPPFIEVVQPVCVIPAQARMKELLDQGYLLICTVNPRVLEHKDGYSSHAILVYAKDERAFSAHDPGLPPLRAQQIPFELFERAWASPNDQAKNIFAIRSRKVA